MLWSCVKTEQKKLRHSHLWLAFLVIPLLPAFMGAANYVNNLELLKSEWYSLWTQHSLFYANFFYAPLIALYCSYIWRVEHLNYNWNQLMTMPVPPAEIFLSKLLLAVRCTVVLQLWMWVLFLSAGKTVGSEVTKVKPGDRVVVNVETFCGSALHGDPKLRGAYRPGASGKRGGTSGQQRRLRPVLALFPDADGDERQ